MANGSKFAFPSPESYAHGLTKREYLAGLAMQALVTKYGGFTFRSCEDRADVELHADFKVDMGEAAVQYADSLLLALEINNG